MMYRKGITGKTWRMLQALYKDLNVQIIHPLLTSASKIPFSTGLTEGSKLSPILYTFFINSLLEELEQKGMGITLHSQYTTPIWLGGLAYADDLVLIANTPQELQQMLTHLQDWASRHMATINITKTKIVAFMETNEQKAERTQDHPIWTLHSTTGTSSQPSPIEETTSFRYLGTTLDANLSMQKATSESLTSFWYAHKKAATLGVHPHGLHPYIKITLWKQLVSTQLSTNLIFIHEDKDTSRLQHAITTSLTQIFAPHTHKYKNSMPNALLTELGIPDIHSWKEILLLHLYARLETIPPERPARRLLTFLKTETHPPAYSPLLHRKIQNLLATLNAPDQWNHFKHIITKTANSTTPKLATQRATWAYTHAHKILLRRHAHIQKWGEQGDPSNPASRRRTYLEITQEDRKKLENNAIHRKNPFQPAQYLTQIQSAQLADTLLCLRCQTGPIPVNIPWPPDHPFLDTSRALPNNEQTTHLARCPPGLQHCRHATCTPPRQTWDNFVPGPHFPQGTLQHLLLECPHYTHRTTLSREMDSILDNLSPGGLLDEEKPWTTLTNKQKLQTLLASTPPENWALTKKQAIRWIPMAEPIIHAWLQPILHEHHHWLTNADRTQ
jgi:hypothetical protein